MSDKTEAYLKQGYLTNLNEENHDIAARYARMIQNLYAYEQRPFDSDRWAEQAALLEKMASEQEQEEEYEIKLSAYSQLVDREPKRNMVKIPIEELSRIRKGVYTVEIPEGYELSPSFPPQPHYSGEKWKDFPPGTRVEVMRDSVFADDLSGRRGTVANAEPPARCETYGLFVDLDPVYEMGEYGKKIVIKKADRVNFGRVSDLRKTCW